MIFEKSGRVRLTRHELNFLRTSAALNGKTVNEIGTMEELLSAVIDGLPPQVAADLLEFLERSHSPPAESSHEDQLSPGSDRRTPPR